jgi:hypothetical protein
LIFTVISLVSGIFEDYENNKIQNKRRKNIIEFFGSEPDDEKTKIITKGYLYIAEFMNLSILTG